MDSKLINKVSHSAATSWNISNRSFAQLILDWMSTFKRIKSNKFDKNRNSKTWTSKWTLQKLKWWPKISPSKKAIGQECLIDVCTKMTSLLLWARVITIPKSDHNSRKGKKKSILILLMNLSIKLFKMPKSNSIFQNYIVFRLYPKNVSMVLHQKNLSM